MTQPIQAPNAWRVLTLLFLANLVNFFDRAVPAIVLEPIRKEWTLSDLQLGLISAAFTVTYAVASIPLGRMADTRSRKTIMGLGLIVWSGFTALAAAASSFSSFLITRIGVGIGEASYAPAATSLIGDMFPANKRSRAVGIFMLGLPVGLLLAFFTVGAMVKAFESWRAPFVIAMLPGLLIAVFMFFIREPERGAADSIAAYREPVSNPIRKILAIRTMRWIMVAGIAGNFAAYATNSFMVPLIQRYFELPLEMAAVSTGVIVGITGLVGLTFGGWAADWMHGKLERGRLTFAAVCLAVSACATWYALTLGADRVGLFVAVFSFGWLLHYSYFVCVYPAIQDVVEPRLRSTAMAVFLGILSLFGGAFGPIVVGQLSDSYALAAMTAAGATEMTEEFKAIGLHGAMILVPISLLVTALAAFIAARKFPDDARAMSADLQRHQPQPAAR